MNKRGFTLLEILIVVLIIGILGAIALPQYTNVVEKQRATEALEILSSIEKAEVRYNAVNDSFATNFSELDVDLKNNSNGNDASSNSFSTKYFTYKLESNKVTATHISRGYVLTKNLYSGEGDVGETRVCCTGGEDDICLKIDMVCN